MEISVPYDNITFDASAKTITLTGYYSGISREQIQHIKNLTTGDTLYNCLFPNKYNISVSSGVITHNYDNSNHNDTDIIQVTVMLSESMGYNSTTDSLKMTEQAPIDQQVLDEHPLNAVSTATTSTPITVLDKDGLTVLLKVTNGATGGTFKIQTVDPDGATYDLGFYDLTSTSADKVVGKTVTTGNYVFHLPCGVKLPKVQIDISSVTDGEFSAWIYGGAI